MGRRKNRRLRYVVKFQDSNVAIIQFCKDDIIKIFEKTIIFVETTGEYFDPKYINNSMLQRLFWKSFKDALLEVKGVLFVMLEGHEIIIVKNPSLPNWQDIIKDVIWVSLIFINADDAVHVSKKDGKIISKPVVCKQFG